jgi:arabinogalactan oligomer / maltooligosaccharide transport system permease protein
MDLITAILKGLQDALPALLNSLREILPIVAFIFVAAIALEVGLYYLLTRVLKTKYALPYALLTPSIIGLALFLGWPLIFNVIIAFSNWRLVNLLNPSFGIQYGIANLQKVFTDPLLNTPDSGFWVVFGRTIVWTVVNVFFHVTLGFALALLLNRQLRGRGLYRTFLIIPWAIPMVIAGLVWKGEFHQQYGFVNLTLAKFGISGPPWLTDGFWAFVAVIIANVWRGIPFMMIIILGGLQSIAGEYYEAAQLDGASAWQQFRSITLPLLMPVLGPAVTLGAIWTFNNLDVIYLITEGGPSEQTNTLVTALYNAAFGFSKFGFGAMFSLVIFLILFAFSVFWLRISGALKGVYES